MQSDTDSEGNELIQLGETILNQAFDENHNQYENDSNSSDKNNLYVHVVQLSNFLKAFNSSNTMKDSDTKQVLQLISNIFSDLNSIKKIPTSDVGPQSPVNESYKILAYSLYLLLKNQNVDLFKSSKDASNINLNENNNLENSSELLSFLAEEYDLPRNLSQKEIITTIREYKRNENSLSPKKEVNGEIQSLKIKIKKLQNSQKETDSSLKEKIDALAKINEVQKKEISKLQKQNQNLQSQVNMAMAEALSISKSPLSDKYDDINRARLHLLENDIKSIKSQYDHLKNKKEKISAENKQLKIDIQKLIENGKKKDSQIIELKHALAEQKIENEQLSTNKDIKSLLNSDNAEVKLKEGENKKLSSALNEISNHLKSMSSEISIELDRSNVLYEITQKLLIATNKYDMLLDEKEKEISKNKILINEYKSTINNLKERQAQIERNDEQNKENLQIIEEIKKYLSNKNLSNHFNEELYQIIENESNSSPKVINLIDFILTKYIKKKKIAKKNKNIEQQNSRLIEFCSSLLQFFEQLANSGEMQQWIIGSPQDESFRPLLLVQCNRIESFLNQYKSELDLKYEDFLSLPSRIERIVNDEIKPQSREVILLFQLCSTVNDALRRYAVNLNDANHALVNDIHELRHEIQQVSNECVFTFDEIQKSKSLSSSLKISQKAMNPKLEEVMNIIQRSASINNNENEKDTIEKIISTLNPNYPKVSKDEIQSLMQENNKIKEENTQLKKQNNEINSTIKLTLKENDELKKKEKSVQLQLNQLQEIINDQENQIKSIKESSNIINNEYDLLQEANADQINELNEAIKNWKMKCSSLENELNNQKSSLKSTYSKSIQKLHKENEEIKNQMETLRNQFEEQIESVQTKLKESVESESKLANELKNSNLKLKQASSDLSTTRVENKILKLKISTSDEKMQREKNLLETHFKMNKLNLETKHETEIESIKAEFDKQFHDFLVSICERFKDFFDFNQPISESSVQSLLINVGNELKREKERLSIFEMYSNEMNTVRSILGINESESIVPVISRIVKKSNKNNNDYEKKSIEIKENQNTQMLYDQSASEWEQWAKKLILMVSDNFISTKSSKNLQNAIEEAVMAGISQRGLIKKIGILRSEKVLLKNGKIYIKGRNRKPSLNSLLLVYSCIRRLQINSGHLPSVISTYNRNVDNQFVNENKNDNEIHDDSKSQKTAKRNYPIITPL